MKLSWMGKYRDVVEAMVRYGNAYSYAVTIKGVISDPPINSLQLQVLEYLIENEERHDNMSQIANRLHIHMSTFSKTVRQLEAFGLLERYHMNGNRKNVIIVVTDLGKELYEQYASGPKTEVWKKTFEMLDKLDDESVEALVNILDLSSEYLFGELGRTNDKKTDTFELVSRDRKAPKP